MYTKIINPKTGRKVSIKTKLGQNIIKKYLNVVRGEKQFGGQPTPAQQHLINLVLYGTTAADGSRYCNPDVLCHPDIKNISELYYVYKKLTKLCNIENVGGYVTSPEKWNELQLIGSQLSGLGDSGELRKQSAQTGTFSPGDVYLHRRGRLLNYDKLQQNAIQAVEVGRRPAQRAAAEKAAIARKKEADLLKVGRAYEAKAAVEQDTISYADYKALSQREKKLRAKYLERRREEAAQARAQALAARAAEAARPHQHPSERPRFSRPVQLPQAQAAEEARPQTRAADSPLVGQPHEAGGYKAKLTAFWSIYAPEKLGTEDAVLAKYFGREEEMITKLKYKYTRAAPQSRRAAPQSRRTAPQSPRAAPQSRRTAPQSPRAAPKAAFGGAEEEWGMEVEEPSSPLDKEAAAWQQQQWQQQQELLRQQAQQSSGFGAFRAQPSGGSGFAPQQSRGFGAFRAQPSGGFGGASGAQPSGGLGLVPPIARTVFGVPAFGPNPSVAAGFERSRMGGPSYGPSTQLGNRRYF